MWLDVHAASHIDRKHINSLLRCSYTVDYVDAVLLDERSSLAVPAIHAFLKTFFPKLASLVLTEQTCSIIDNLVATLTSMVEVVDIQASAHRLTGDLRALALVYNNSSEIKPAATLHGALETLLSRTRIAKTKLKDEKPQGNVEAPKKKRKINTPTKNEETNSEGQETSNEKEETNSACSPKSEAVKEGNNSSEDKEEKEEKESSEAVAKTSNSEDKSSSSLVAASNNSSTSSVSNQSGDRPMNSLSWLDMLEKTIVNLQMVLHFQNKK